MLHAPRVPQAGTLLRAPSRAPLVPPTAPRCPLLQPATCAQPATTAPAPPLECRCRPPAAPPAPRAFTTPSFHPTQPHVRPVLRAQSPPRPPAPPSPPAPLAEQGRTPRRVRPRAPFARRGAPAAALAPLRWTRASPAPAAASAPRAQSGARQCALRERFLWRGASAPSAPLARIRWWAPRRARLAPRAHSTPLRGKQVARCAAWEVQAPWLAPLHRPRVPPVPQGPPPMARRARPPALFARRGALLAAGALPPAPRALLGATPPPLGGTPPLRACPALREPFRPPQGSPRAPPAREGALASLRAPRARTPPLRAPRAPSPCPPTLPAWTVRQAPTAPLAQRGPAPLPPPPAPPAPSPWRQTSAPRALGEGGRLRAHPLARPAPRGLRIRARAPRMRAPAWRVRPGAGARRAPPRASFAAREATLRARAPRLARAAPRGRRAPPRAKTSAPCAHHAPLATGRPPAPHFARPAATAPLAPLMGAIAPPRPASRARRARRTQRWARTHQRRAPPAPRAPGPRGGRIYVPPAPRGVSARRWLPPPLQCARCAQRGSSAGMAALRAAIGTPHAQRGPLQRVWARARLAPRAIITGIRVQLAPLRATDLAIIHLRVLRFPAIMLALMYWAVCV